MTGVCGGVKVFGDGSGDIFLGEELGVERGVLGLLKFSGVEGRGKVYIDGDVDLRLSQKTK